MKILIAKALINSEQKESEVLETLRLASDVCTQRSYKGLITTMRERLPSFFGFDAIGVLLKDQKTGDLFTISEVNRAEENLKGEDAYRKPNSTIKFPATLGISGMVMRTGELFISNKAQKEHKFCGDIDNLSS